MGLWKFVPSVPPIERSHPRRQERVVPEIFLTDIFEHDLTARAAGLKLSKTEVGEGGDILLNRIDLSLGYDNVKWLADLLQAWKTNITEALITVLNARGLVVLARCLNHLLQNAGDNKVYLVKQHYPGDASDSRSFDTLFVGIGE